MLLVFIVFWGFGTEISGAVVARGNVKVAYDRQIIQHPDGGVVSSINARDGDIVLKDDVLLRFDNTYLKSELAVTDRQLMEIYARKARYRAESVGAEILTIESTNFTRLDPIWVQEQIAGQIQLFDARLASLASETGQYQAQKTQITRQIAGINQQNQSLLRQLELISTELADQQSLLKKRLVPLARMHQLQRETARLEGEIGRLKAADAQARARISQIRVQTLKLSNQRREEAVTRLRDLRYSEIQLTEQQIRIREQLNRMVVRAPVSGIIYGSNNLALKSVVQAADPIMYIVPRDKPFLVSAQVDPTQIDQLSPGQSAILRFVAFEQFGSPEILGKILRLSADTLKNEITGAPYYEVIIKPDFTENGILPIADIRPGIPVEVFMTTDNRTPLSFFVQPVMNYFNRAFREG